MICPFTNTHKDDGDLAVLPLSDVSCVLPYGADEKFPQKIKQVGGIAA